MMNYIIFYYSSAILNLYAVIFIVSYFAPVYIYNKIGAGSSSVYTVFAVVIYVSIGYCRICAS